MIPVCMTTFGDQYWQRYGRESVTTWLDKWPGKIVTYGEGKPPADLPKQVEYRDLFAIDGMLDFLRWTSMVPLLQGIMPNGEYSYHFNANKFARKVFAISEMKEPFFFIGADVHMTKPIPAEFLNRMLDGKFGAFLFRGAAHTESDFAGYNTAHPEWEKFIVLWKSLYVNGGFLALTETENRKLAGFHDCWTLDWLLRVLNLKDQCLDITNGARGDDETGMHVWPKTVLAEYMVHLKGRIKKDPEKKAEALRGAA